MDDPIERIRRAVADLSAGKPLVLTNVDPDGEGHLIVAAQCAATAAVAYLVRYGSGLIIAAMTESDCTRLSLPLMVNRHRQGDGVDYLVSVDASDGIGTGISAADRATTLRLLASPDSGPTSFSRPGHVLPARAHSRGVLGRRTPVEAAVDLTAIADICPVAAVTGLVSSEDPTRMAGLAESERFAYDQNLSCVSIDDVAVYRRATEAHVAQTFAVMQTGPSIGSNMTGFRSGATGLDYIAYRVGERLGDRTSVVLQWQHGPVGDVDGKPHELCTPPNWCGVVLVAQGEDLARRLGDVSADIAEVLQALDISAPVFGGASHWPSLEALSTSLNAHPAGPAVRRG